MVVQFLDTDIIEDIYGSYSPRRISYEDFLNQIIIGLRSLAMYQEDKYLFLETGLSLNDYPYIILAMEYQQRLNRKKLIETQNLAC